MSDTTMNLKKALDEYIDEMDFDMDNPLEPIKVASAMKSEMLKWQLREREGQDHSPLDVTIFFALMNALEGVE